MNAPRDSMAGVDSEHPWIGLASFTESSRGYFHGRDEEINELCRRIQRKPLTVLFGQSGLGKTSILQAGVVPRLRGQGYCPIYLRIDYAAGAPSAEEQIKQAIMKGAEQSGRWTRARVTDEGESLWAFLHHRDDVLIDSLGLPLLPLLIFDQFEEIFTLAQADEQGRERAAAFTADLADLVENRLPAELEALLEQDDGAYERYDLARADYRVVIALREDYLAHLEGLKGAMPSITQNRLRLAPMTGAQALSAIVEPGRHLVNEEVAAAIVRFVAGGAEVAHAEVEPSLLSLICRELNDQRIALGRAEVGADLLAGSHTSILGEFYERSVADQPVGVHTFIEDHLLTDSGYRENVAEERVRSEFAAAGAQPEALALLVNRRLLRIEERLDLRRVELTHDVLCAVVRASRDARHEREALAASERLAAEQSERARNAQRALKRARAVASVCILLAVGAVAASGFAIVSSRRAEQAQRDAQATRLRAEQLLGYLQNDFAAQLIPLGRLDLVGSLNDKVVAYFDAAPDDQRTPEWEHSRALALLAQAETRSDQGRTAEAKAPLDMALRVFDARYGAGHRSETDLAELGKALSDQGHWLHRAKADFRGASLVLERAERLLAEATASGRSSEATRMIQARISGHICYGETVGDGFSQQDVIAHCELAVRQSAELGALAGSNPIATTEYILDCWTLMIDLDRQGRSDEAVRMAGSASRLGHEAISKWPEFTRLQIASSYVNMELARVYGDRLELQNATQADREAEATYAHLIRSDSTLATSWSDLGLVRVDQGDWAWEQGNPAEASVQFHAAIDAFDSAKRTGFILNNAVRAATRLVYADDDRGDRAGLEKSLAHRNKFFSEMKHLSPGVSQEALALQQCHADALEAQIASTANDQSRSAKLAIAGLASIDAIHFSHPHSRAEESCRYDLTYMLARAEYRSSDMVASEASLRSAISAHDAISNQSLGHERAAATLSTWLALTQIHQGRVEDAKATLAPVLVLQRALFKQSNESSQQHLELAMALYAQALTVVGVPHRALLAEAAALVSGLPTPMRALHSVQMWEDWISKARKGSDTPPSKDAGRD